MSYLIDTDILVFQLRNKYPKINEKINNLNANQISISSISVAELFFGAYNSADITKNIRLVSDLINEINIIDFDIQAAEKFGEIKAELNKNGTLISDSDLFIASTAISNDLILVTNNEKHFNRINYLKIENWITMK